MSNHMQIEILLLDILLCFFTSCVRSQLSPGFYANSFPNLLEIVSSTYQSLAARDNVVSPSTFRMSMHDCFVQLRGPSWQVDLGRRDSRTSLAANGAANIPRSNLDGDKLISLFSSKGLDVVDLVALSGAHSIGFSRCRQFDFRLNGGDPFYDEGFTAHLRGESPQLGSSNVLPLDPASPFIFDESYYISLQLNRGLLLTDQALFVHPQTKDLVIRFAAWQS